MLNQGVSSVKSFAELDGVLLATDTKTSTRSDTSGGTSQSMPGWGQMVPYGPTNFASFESRYYPIDLR